MKQNIFKFLLISLIVFFEQSYVSADNKDELNNPKNILQKSTFKEGSTERWNHIINNIHVIKIGMTKKEVINILGPEDTNQFVPKNTMQYSVYYENRPDGDDGQYIQIRLDDNGIVIKIERTDYVYGPPPG